MTSPQRRGKELLTMRTINAVFQATHYSPKNVRRQLTTISQVNPNPNSTTLGTALVHITMTLNLFLGLVRLRLTGDSFYITELKKKMNHH